MISLAPMPKSAAHWLHPIFNTYYGDLVPGAQGLPIEAMSVLWEDPTLTLLTIYSHENPVGFAIIQTQGGCHALSEICVLPAFRSKGIGTEVVAQCLQLFPGRWALDVAKTLPGTARFWDRVLTSLPGIVDLKTGPAHTPYQSHSFTFEYKGAP